MKPRLKRALLEAALALVLAVPLTMIVYAIGGAQFGADVSQRIIAALQRSPLAIVEWREGGDDRSFVLLDIDLQSCEGRRAPCTITDPLKGARLADVLRAVRAEGPELVIVDAFVAGSAAVRSGAVDTKRMPGQQGGAAALDPALRAELKRAGAPVLIAWTADRSRRDPEHRALRIDGEDLAVLRPGEFEQARFFPAFFVGGAISRRLTPSVCLIDGDGVFSVTPTLPYAAALALRYGGTKALDRFPMPASSDAGRKAACSAIPGDPLSRQFAASERVFSAGSIRPEDTRSADRIRGVDWVHRKFAADRRGSLPRLEGKVVLIGSADPDAGDLHSTALGQMSGSEIILNDTRQFLVAEPAPSGNVISRTKGKWPFFLAGAIAVLLAHFLFPAPLGSLPWLRRSGRRLLHTIAPPFFIAIAFGILLGLDRHLLHSPPDFVTPFLALLAETLFELLFGLNLKLRKLAGIESHGDAA